MRMKREELKVRMTEEERRAFEDAAKVAGISLSAWMRERLRTAARKDLEDAGLPISFIEEIRQSNGREAI